MSSCTRFARCTLASVNVIFFLGGAATIAVAVAGRSLGIVDDIAPFVLATVTGSFLVILSLFGCIGTWCAKPSVAHSCVSRTAIAVYVTLVLVVLAGNFCAGAIMFAWHGELASVGAASDAASGLQAEVDQWIQEYYAEPYCCGPIPAPPQNASQNASLPHPAVNLAKTCRVLKHEFDCDNYNTFSSGVEDILKSALLPAGITCMMLSFLALLGAIAAGCMCRRLHLEGSVRYAHLLIDDDDADAEAYQRIAGVSSSQRRRSSASRKSMLGVDLDYHVSSVNVNL